MTQEQVSQVLNDPLAQDLLRALEYPGPAGVHRPGRVPRAIPIGFLWTGTHFVRRTATNSPKVPALQTNSQLALTIDTNTFPAHSLLVRGRAQVEIVERVEGVAPEFLAGSQKYVAPEQWAGFEQQGRALYKEHGRITIVSEWAKILDFGTRIPQAQEELVRQAAGPL